MKTAKAHAKTIICLNSLGNLPHSNLKQANLNQVPLMKHLRARGTGAYIDPATAKRMRAGFDLVRMDSNINPNGNIAGEDRFISHQGHSDFVYYDTAMGKIMQQRANDIEQWKLNEEGDPECVYTMGVSKIHRDSGRVIEYCAHIAVHLLLADLQTPGDDKAVIGEATTLARSNDLIESDEDNQVSRSMIYISELAGQSILQLPIAGLEDSIRGIKGLTLGQITESKVSTTLHSDIPSVYIPMIQQQAQTKSQKIQEAIESRLQQLMRKQTGLWSALLFMGYLLQILEKSRQALMDKANDVQSFPAKTRITRSTRRNPRARNHAVSGRLRQKDLWPNRS